MLLKLNYCPLPKYKIKIGQQIKSCIWIWITYRNLSWTSLSSSSSSSSSSTSRAIGLTQTFGIDEARSVITKVLAAQDQKSFKSRCFYADKFIFQNKFWHKEHQYQEKSISFNEWFFCQLKLFFFVSCFFNLFLSLFRIKTLTRQVPCLASC